VALSLYFRHVDEILFGMAMWLNEVTAGILKLCDTATPQNNT
jgi:hypothetical protein